VYYAHQAIVEEDLVLFYDVHEHDIDGNNNDDVYVSTIIPKTASKENQIIHSYVRYLVGGLLIFLRIPLRIPHNMHALQ
jgi:hypothetical protein